MRALLWKDYRVNRGVLVMGVALLLGPYVAVAAGTAYEYWPVVPPAAQCAALLVVASVFSLGLSQLTLVTLAGNAIAAERADRSAEFLAYLPPSRLRILASKALLALLAAAVIWAVNLIVADIVAPAVGTPRGNLVDGLADRSILAASSVMLFGAAWLGSAFLTSPAIATSLGLGATLAVPFLVAATFALLGWPREDLQHWYELTCLVLGGLCFACGSAYYLRRVEP